MNWKFNHLKFNKQLWLLLLPYLGGTFFLVIIPAVFSLSIAFFKYDGLSRPEWVGALNFILVYNDELFKLSLQNSLALVILPVPLRVFSAFFVARLLQKNGRFVNAFRLSIFLPTVIPGAAFALAWLWIFNPLSGPLNLLLQSMGLFTPAWLVEPIWVKPALVFSSLWQIGEGVLVSLAALLDIPPELNEAAIIDGANRWHHFRWIQLPLLAPILLILMFRDVVLTLQESFTAVLLMTEGGPYYASYTLPQFIYEKGFDLLFFGSASAALWVLYLVTGVIVLGVYIIARQWQVETSEAIIVL